MKGLLLAGGHGTRLRPLTFTGNKHMIPIGNKPMLFHGLEHLIRAGIKEIGIVLGPIREGISETIGDGSKFGVNVTYIEQPYPKGLAHAVFLAEKFIDNEPFVLYLGDNLIKQGVKPLIYTYFNDSSDCVICVSPVRNTSQYGIVELDSSGNALKLVEKPKEAKSNLALAGVYLFNEHIFPAVKSIKPSWRGELEITDAIQYLLSDDRKISVQRITGWWKDTGRPEDLLEANQLVLDDLEAVQDSLVKECYNITGKVSIGKNTIIRQDARIKGPVIIGDDCEIGHRVYIGPYTSIGDNSKILSGEIDSSIIMQNVHVDCKKRIVDSIVGTSSKIDAAENLLPGGIRLVVGESTACSI